MCGRFTYANEFRDIRIRFDLDKDIPLFRPRYNIAPGQEMAVITQGSWEWRFSLA
ncbi:MAG: SOS response-associated peptidase family protein [Candidatus Binatia bacterium]